MTWKEFKENVEKQGVTDNMKINYIDISPWENDKLVVVLQKNGEFRIYG